ncbi:MAG: dTMP kinase [Defluviitaleaceae bacterium]|nr:dTMP kinase [Defluviitaleaceae bacterium]MCL2264265.1 dTMP kinase [Defluviitaleaceae bacterium]
MSKFFVIEGLDGSGKTTQARRLAEWFAANNKPCFTTRQPSDDKIGELARAATYGVFPAENETLALLFAAEHYQHYCGKIAPALNRGEYVICDRYYYSNFVYQGIDAPTLQRIFSYNQAVMTAKKPDAVLFIDVSPDECMRRINESRAQTSIFEALDKLTLQRERFLSIFKHLGETENIITIQTENLNEDSVFDKILEALQL